MRLQRGERRVEELHLLMNNHLGAAVQVVAHRVEDVVLRTNTRKEKVSRVDG